MAEAGSQETVLGPDVQIKGTLSFDKVIHLQGRLEGNVTGNGRLHVAKEGKVAGDVEAAEVVIEGDVCGDVTASDRVELKASAHYEGNLRSGRLAIEAGAFFTGHVTVGEPAKDRPAGKAPPGRVGGNNKVAELQSAR